MNLPPEPDAAALLDELRASRERIRELETRLEESEDTLEAIRSGTVDAVVVLGPDADRQVYTLESADRPYRVLIEQIQEGALTLSRDGTILYCNPRLAEMLGGQQERVIGRQIGAFVCEEDQGPLAWMLQAAAASGARGELSFKGEGDAPRSMLLSLSLLERGEGSPLLCGVVADLTQQNTHLRELAAANDRLRAESLERERIEEVLRQSQKMEAVGQLTGGVAHDFNNLLTVIKSSSDLLKRSNLAEERRARYVAAISDTVDRAAKLTGQLLAFARRQALKPEVFDARDSVRALSDMMGTLTGSRIRIGTELSKQPGFVSADPSQFDTALVNLAVNARDAMNGEGRITIAVRAVDGIPAVRSHAAVAGPFVAVSLSDTGSGIPADRTERIFEPFFTTKEVGKGTGLGLSQVFGFAKQSGGDITVDSAVGEGATFTLYLPRVPAPAQATAADEAEAPVDGLGTRVLVVEDNADVGAFAVQSLTDLGYATVLAIDGTAALAELAKDPDRFDVVFSDVMMPGMSGIELGQEIRRLYQDLPVVLTSGYSHVLAENGTFGFDLLHKPYSVEQLSQVLRKSAKPRRRKRLLRKQGTGGPPQSAPPPSRIEPQ